MEVHVLILSTMSSMMTIAFLKYNNIDIVVDKDIQRFNWTRSKLHQRKLTIWIACHTPLTNELLSSLVPYMDAVVCLYHDHDALSCLKMRAAMESVSRFHDVIYPMMTAVPRLHRRHQSRIQKFYNKNGFERERLTGALHEAVERILKLDLNIVKTLDGLV